MFCTARDNMYPLHILEVNTFIIFEVTSINGRIWWIHFIQYVFHI